jgi:hypothetical protein
MRSFRLTWKWSLLVTLPVSVIFVYWFWLTSSHFFTFGVRYDSTPVKVTLHKTGITKFQEIKRQIEMTLIPKYFAEKGRLLRNVSIFVSETDIAKLNSNLPHSGFDYVKGQILVGDEIKNMSARYRGDTYLHWGTEKKSFRIKTKKKFLYEGMRKFNILAPKDINIIVNHSSYLLAKNLGLLVPYSEMVDLYVNGKPRGVHVLVEQLEELTLRNSDRMPGDIYSGELFAKDSYVGVSPYVFEHAGLWTKASTNNHFELDSRAPLAELISLINSEPSKEQAIRLNNLLDIPAWGKFAAFEALSQSFHFDKRHNWRLYYDPWKNKFEPIIWDPVGWVTASSDNLPLVEDVSRTRLHNALYNDSEFILEKQRTLERFFTEDTNESFLLELDEVIKKVDSSIIFDPNIPDLAKVQKNILRFRKRVESVLARVRATFLEVDENFKYSVSRSEDNTYRFKMTLDGRIPVERIELVFDSRLEEVPDAMMKFWTGKQEQSRSVNGAVSIKGNRIRLNVPMIANYKPMIRKDLNVNVQGVSASYYELVLSGITDNRFIDLVAYRGDDVVAKTKKVDTLENIPFSTAYNVIRDKPYRETHIWDGDKVFSGVNRFSNEVVIRAGSNIKLMPNASLIFENRVTAQGTKDKPIVFSRGDGSLLPWGTVALRGELASGSRFEFCEFDGGSGYKGELFEYSSMFSVHDVRDVSIDHCKFRNNSIVDDMVHVIYSEIEITNSEFSDAISDALDIDISKATIKNSMFIGSGNDAVDLMSSDATFIGNEITNSGDKGISVGEGSRLLAINNVIKNNLIGVQSKDGSVATLYNVDLFDNEKALDAYKKNWRYDSGGKIYLYKSRIARNTKNISADKNSKIAIYDSSFDILIEDKRKNPKIILRASSLRSGQSNKVKSKRFWRFPEEVNYMDGFSQINWSSAESGQRGSKVVDIEN